MTPRPKRARRSTKVWLGILGACSVLTGLANAQPPVRQDVAAAPALPIAIVPLNTAATVNGALKVTSGTAMIATSGSITSGAKTTPVTLPRRGVLRVCASTTVKLAADTSVPADETPGLTMALDHGAIEASFAVGNNSDVLLTPDFRILIGAPGSADVKVRIGEHGDTCLDNGGNNAPYVLVTSVFDGGAYRVQPGQRVMFQHGSLQEVIDQEKEPCGCPPDPAPNSNDFPLAQSAGLAPLEPPKTSTEPVQVPATVPPATQSEPLIYQAKPEAKSEPTAGQPPPVEPTTAATPTQPAPVPAPAKPKSENKPGFFHRVGHFFRKIFGAD